MAQLDVIVINADTFEKAALVQIPEELDVNKKLPQEWYYFFMKV